MQRSMGLYGSLWKGRHLASKTSRARKADNDYLLLQIVKVAPDCNKEIQNINHKYIANNVKPLPNPPQSLLLLLLAACLSETQAHNHRNTIDYKECEPLPMPHQTILLLLLSTGLSQAPLHTGRNILTHDPQTVRRITIQPHIISNYPNNRKTREL
jgi:hypothetical protein